MELSTIAKPYAQAIFEIAEENSSLSEWSELLSTASAIMADDATQAFVASPGKSKDQKVELICALLEKATSRELSKQESAFIILFLIMDVQTHLAVFLLHLSPLSLTQIRVRVFKL